MDFSNGRRRKLRRKQFYYSTVVGAGTIGVATIVKRSENAVFTYAVLRCCTKTLKQKAMPIGRFNRNYNSAICTTASIIFRVLAIRMGMVQNDEQTADWCFGRRSKYSEFKIICEPRCRGGGSVHCSTYECVCECVRTNANGENISINILCLRWFYIEQYEYIIISRRP